MNKKRSWLDGVSDTLGEWGAILCTRDFWAVFAVVAAILGVLVTGMVMLTNFDMARMSCRRVSDLNAYLMFNIFLIFVFGGMLTVGELFSYLENRKRGIPHKINFLFWALLVAMGLGVVGLVMLGMFC